MDSIAFWTILEYLSITSYSSILLVNKEWYEHLISLPKFKKNKEIITNELFFGDSPATVQPTEKQKYNDNYDIIIYLLKLNNNYAHYKSVIFQLAHFSLKKSKEIIFRFQGNNGPNILYVLPLELQKDKDILQRACVFNTYSKEFCKQYFTNSDWLDYNFCKSFLNIFKENKSALYNKYLLSEINNKQSVIDYINLNITNIENMKNIFNLNKEIVKMNIF
ncbi:hypothetical protein ABK040_000752 [Willaertia magna]